MLYLYCVIFGIAIGIGVGYLLYRAYISRRISRMQNRLKRLRTEANIVPFEMQLRYHKLADGLEAIITNFKSLL